MKESHILALIVAYYLSKFDEKAYSHLAFGNTTETHDKVGQILGVKGNSVKNMRDEFDPLHDNPRMGWHQRPLRPSREKVVQSFQDLNEEEMFDVVTEILGNPEFINSDELVDIVEPILRRAPAKRRKTTFIPRGPTGRKAEEYFIQYHFLNGLPIIGELIDRREDGCGYDFEICGDNHSVIVEVKGLSLEQGGISFTSKEWRVAEENGERFYVALVSNIDADPRIDFYLNPFKTMAAKKHVFTTVQVRWNVSSVELNISE